MRSTTVTLFLTAAAANVDAPGPDSPVSDATTAAADKLLRKEVSASSRTRCCYGESSHTPPLPAAHKAAGCAAALALQLDALLLRKELAHSPLPAAGSAAALVLQSDALLLRRELAHSPLPAAGCAAALAAGSAAAHRAAGCAAVPLLRALLLLIELLAVLLPWLRRCWILGPVSTHSRLTSALDAEPAADADLRVIGDPEVCAGHSPREGA
jgi:hypothetical protein